MSEFDRQKSRICPHCNAKQLGPSDECWLCHKSLTAEPEGLPPPAIVPELYESDNMSFSLATMFLLVTLASVCMGLLVAVPGWGIFACIVMVPVFFRTMRVVRYREAIGKAVTPMQKVVMFSTSFAVSSVLVIVVCVSAFCSFCGVCLSIVGFGDGEGDMFAWGLGMCIAAVVGFVVMVKLIKWIRYRYRRDIGEE